MARKKITGGVQYRLSGDLDGIRRFASSDLRAALDDGVRRLADEAQREAYKTLDEGLRATYPKRAGQRRAKGRGDRGGKGLRSALQSPEQVAPVGGNFLSGFTIFRNPSVFSKFASNDWGTTKVSDNPRNYYRVFESGGGPVGRKFWGYWRDARGRLTVEPTRGPTKAQVRVYKKRADELYGMSKVGKSGKVGHITHVDWVQLQRLGGGTHIPTGAFKFGYGRRMSRASMVKAMREQATFHGTGFSGRRSRRVEYTGRPLSQWRTSAGAVGATFRPIDRSVLGGKFGPWPMTVKTPIVGMGYMRAAQRWLNNPANVNRVFGDAARKRNFRFQQANQARTRGQGVFYPRGYQIQ